MPTLPQRQSLVSQTASFLVAQIEAGEWRDWLPSERALCDLLQVSRNTLRTALHRLQSDGRIRAVHGAGNQILQTAAAVPAPRAADVALLTPEPIERLRPTQSLWIDHMRALLSERGLRLRVFHGSPYFAANPGPALQRLVSRHPHGCWILMLAGESVQRWFSRNGVPCILAGSPHPGVDLPFRDLDHRAICRHAAGVLLGLGHRRLAFLTGQTRRAGDIESEAGFLEAVKQSRHAEAGAVVIHHDGTLGSITNAVTRLARLKPVPTGLLVVHPHHYLAVASQLHQLALQIPAQISLVSRDDDPALSFIVPPPARYVTNPRLLARSLLRPVLEVLDGRAITQRQARIMPEFVRGDTIAAAPR